MTKRPHVPKFGDWNNRVDGDIPYTVVFDKARIGKWKDGMKIMNPNDHQENPEAFHECKKEIVKEGPMNIKLSSVSEHDQECSILSETIVPPSSLPIKSFKHHRHKSDEQQVSMCGEMMSLQQQKRKQRLKHQSMDLSTEHHRKHSSISDTDIIKRAHVPKFGEWNNKGENVPYTIVFERARKSKLKEGVKIMNPNDPEENPDAFSVLKNGVKEEPMEIKKVKEDKRSKFKMFSSVFSCGSTGFRYGTMQ